MSDLFSLTMLDTEVEVCALLVISPSAYNSWNFRPVGKRLIERVLEVGGPLFSDFTPWDGLPSVLVLDKGPTDSGPYRNPPLVSFPLLCAAFCKGPPPTPEDDYGAGIVIWWAETKSPPPPLDSHTKQLLSEKQWASWCSGYLEIS